MLVKIPTWNYAKLDCLLAIPPLVAKREISWFHKHIDVAKTFICNSFRPSLGPSVPIVRRVKIGGYKQVAELIGTDSLMHIVPEVWVNRTDALRISSMTRP